MKLTEIFLKRDNMADLPQFDLPKGFTLRSYRKGDEENWFRIYRAADHYNKIYSTMFKEYFGADEELLGRRQFYLCDPQGREIGTATSWFNDDYHGDRFGRVHWVAVHPDYQGQGLAKPMLSCVLQRLADLGHSRCYLRTLSVRTPAVCLYLSFGFRPDIRSEADRQVWRQIGSRLSHHELDDL